MDPTSAPPYQLIRLLATAGMTRIHLARHVATGRQVAVKSVAGGSSKYLEREFEVLRDLRHPNIVPVYERFDLDGAPYFAMAHRDGVCHLLAYLQPQRGVFDRAAARVFRQLVDVLDHLHAQRVVHAALSPAGVLVAPDGVLQLVDFEYARRLAIDETGYWPPNHLAGRPLYMSPEQSRAEACVVESDHFVVGTLLVEHLSGANPFARPDIAQILAAISRVDPSAIVAPLAPLAPDLAPALRQLLDPDPAPRRDGWTAFSRLVDRLTA